MNAPHPSAAFAVARTRAACDEQPTVADSIARVFASMPRDQQIDLIERLAGKLPTASQIVAVQRIAEGPAWNEMAYVDSQKLDRVLVNFATDMDEAAHEEDVRLHGRDENTPSYWL